MLQRCPSVCRHGVLQKIEDVLTALTDLERPLVFAGIVASVAVEQLEYAFTASFGSLRHFRCHLHLGIDTVSDAGLDCLYQFGIGSLLDMPFYLA